MQKSYGSYKYEHVCLGYAKQTYVNPFHALVSNHAPKKQAIYDPKNIQTSKSKSRVSQDSHIVNWTITTTDIVFSWPAWLEVQTNRIDVRYIEVCKKTRVKVVGHRVIQKPQCTQQLHVGVKTLDNCQPLKCTPTWRKLNDINLCEYNLKHIYI